MSAGAEKTHNEKLLRLGEMRAERRDLRSNSNRLSDALRAAFDAPLSLPEVELDRMRAQLSYMRRYETVLAERIEALAQDLELQGNAAATGGEPDPVSPQVSRSVAAALLASLEELLADAEDCARAGFGLEAEANVDSDIQREAPELLAMIKRGRAARDMAKAGGL